MKIGILTQPLHTNYGGLLQCWALQQVLRGMGHEAWVVRREARSHSFKRWLAFHLWECARRAAGLPPHRWPSRRAEGIIRSLTGRFVSGAISPKTPVITSSRGLRRDYALRRYDAYVVGSDQVWRPRYSPCQTDFFLGFLPPDARVLRVAYAASFGTDDWEYSSRLWRACRPLAARFDAVSVRESGGVALCRGRFGVEAVQVLDPTLLHGREAYEALAAGEPRSQGNFFCYLLDSSGRAEALCRDVSALLGLEAFGVMPRARWHSRAPVEDCVYPRVTQWIRAFMDAECVLTDSFHGCVFSVIFNRPFVALGNSSRGQSRFQSLLSLFGLESRLVAPGESSEEVARRMREPIDWERVNRVKADWQDKSMDYLVKALSPYGNQ